jgi:primase-polymerase (primpol)-like protein
MGLDEADGEKERAVTIDELKAQRRWVLHKSKIPYQTSGRKAMPNNPATWSTFAECQAVATQFEGIGVVLGNGVWGCDIDACCDSATGKFTPESRAVVIELDSYGEFSPSGTGCHVLGLGYLPGGGIKKPFPGCKAIEIKSDGFYFTFTARHLSKTPSELMDRQEQITNLYNLI